MATEIERLREELKRGYLRRYLEATGRQILPGGQVRCPNPSAHANGDAKPSAHLYEDASGDRVKCFACGGSWDIFSLVEMDQGTDFIGALEYLADFFGLAFPRRAKRRRDAAKTKTTPTREQGPNASTATASSPTTATDTATASENNAAKNADEAIEEAARPKGAQEYLDTCAARIEETDYFGKRGVSLATAKRLGCGYDPAHYFPSLHERRRAVVFPAAGGWAARAVDVKAHSFLKGLKGGSAFNLEALDQADATSAVFIVEGQFDALSIEDVGGHALALGGVQHVEELVQRVRRNPPGCALIIALDREDNPQKAANVAKAAKRLAEELRGAGAFVADFNDPIFSAHDANDALLADRAAFKNSVKYAVFYASERYVLRDEPQDGDDATTQKDHATPKPGPWAAKTISFADLPEPMPEEENARALFKRGYLRKGHALCLVSCAGVGKSVISLQLALAWSLGKPCLGLEPVRPLKIGVFTFEDDVEDNASFRRDYREGFRREGWSDAEIDAALAAVEFIELGGKTDEAFAEALAEIQLEKPRDLYIVNPLGDIMDEYDISDNSEAKHFFKRVLDPVIKGARDPRTSCALVLVSHTGKAPKTSGDRANFMRGIFAQYDAAGSAALMNWTRASLLIAPTSEAGNFVLLGAKRQARLGWRDADGKPTNERYISYSPDIKFWIPTPEADVRRLTADGSGKSSRPAVDPAQDAATFAGTLRSLTSGISSVEARQRAQDMLGQKRGNAAFAKIAQTPSAFNVAVEKIGRTIFYGGVALGIGVDGKSAPPGVEGLDDDFEANL